MNNVLAIGQIINKNLQELHLRNDLSKELKDVYERISFDLNIAGINNKIINTMDVYGAGEYYFILIDNEKNIDEYFLIDLNLKNGFKKIDDLNFNDYLEKLGINDNKINLKKLFESKTIGR